MIELRLPLAPSLNHYYLNAKRKVRRGPNAGKTYIGRQISSEGVAFRAEVAKAVRAGHRVPPRLSGRLAIEILLVPRDRRPFDLDNRLKATWDALTEAGVIADDALFDELRVARGNAAASGAMFLRIRRFDPAYAMALAAELGTVAGGLRLGAGGL